MMESLGISDQIAIAICYLLCAWPVHLLLGSAGTLVAIVLRFTQRQWVLPVLKVSWMFTGILFMTGFMLNIGWNLCVFNRLYWVYDYAGWECSPFGLIIYNPANTPAQFFSGMNAGTIRGLWAIYAAFAWGLSAWVTYRIVRKNKAVEPANSRDALQRA